MATHDIGDVVTLWAVFRDEAGAQAAPTSVTLYVLAPGASASIEVIAEAAGVDDEARAEAATGETLDGVTGVYRADVTLTAAGWWWYRWLGSGAVSEAGEGWLEVRRQRVPDPPEEP